MAQKKFNIFETKYFGFIIGFFIFILCFFIQGITPLKILDYAVLDTHFNLRNNIVSQTYQVNVTAREHNPNISSDIIIVGVDSNSLEKFGKWPWPRYRHADFLNTLSRIKQQNERERAVLLDFFFVEPSSQIENDALLVDAIKTNGRTFQETILDRQSNGRDVDAENFERHLELFQNQAPITNIIGNPDSMEIFYGAEAPLQPIARVSAGFGHPTFIPDDDKTFRRQALVARTSHLLKTIKVDDLTPNYVIDTNKFQRLGWTDREGRERSVTVPLTTEVIDQLKLDLAAEAPPVLEDKDGDGITDQQYFVVYQYQDYYLPAITLSLALKYFNKTTADIQVKIGEYIQIPKPQYYNVNKSAWEPYRLEDSPAEYSTEKKLESPSQLYLTNSFYIPIPFNFINNELTGKRDPIFVRVSVQNAADLGNNLAINTEIISGRIYTIPIPPYISSGLKRDLLPKIEVDTPIFSEVSVLKKEASSHEVANIRIPIDKQCSMLINFMGQQSGESRSNYQTFPVRSYAGYAGRATQPDAQFWPNTLALSNKIIMAGIFAQGVASDEKKTPFGLMYGIEMHANALNTILMEKFITPLPQFISFIFLFALCMIVAFLASRISPPFALLLTILLIFIFFIFSSLIFDVKSLLIDFAIPSFAMLMTMIAIIAYRVMTEEREKKAIHNMFGKFVSRAVVDQMIEVGVQPELGGVDKELTVFFSDIRGFTTLSESMTPQELVNHLNTYLTAMTDIIMEFKGTLDKYVGDEVMCFWGAPLAEQNHALLACKCALKQMDKLKELNLQWPAEKRIDHGIGINSGIMTVGNMGSMGRMNYTLMGDNVNLGARLEGTNKEYGTHIIISEYTYGLVREEVIVRELDNIRVKGKNKPVLIYELIDIVNL